MAKIRLPSTRKFPTQEHLREIHLEEGELIMLVTAAMVDQSGVHSAHFGVFEVYKLCDKKGDSDIILMKPYFTLRKAMDFGGGLVSPLERHDHPREYHLGSYIREIYTYQSRIVEALESWPGFEAHAKWVGSLTKPYVLKSK
jgi:hypothetical protein